MSEVRRRHVLIQAPIEDVWAVVSDPQTHPGWWPELVGVRAPEHAREGDRYVRVERRLGFLDQVDAVWVVERLEHLKEAHFRCTSSGTYARFALTAAQGDTFVEAEAGILPPNARWRAVKPVFELFFSRWLRDLLDRLPKVVARRRTEAETRSGATV
jgi:Polyketide cyclase / dehydrase and lipid transport